MAMLTRSGSSTMVMKRQACAQRTSVIHAFYIPPCFSAVLYQTSTGSITQEASMRAFTHQQPWALSGRWDQQR